MQFFVRAECVAYKPERAHVPLFFTKQNKDAKKIGHNSDSFETLSVKYLELILFPFLQMTIALWQLSEI